MEYTRVSPEYAKKLAAGTIPQSTIPRTPTSDMAYQHNCNTIRSSGISLGQHIEHTVLKGAPRSLQRSPFPYLCDIGIDHWLYWMSSGYEDPTTAAEYIAGELGVSTESIHIVRNTQQSVPEVAHYQVFVESGTDRLIAPCYELPGNMHNKDYVRIWSEALGYPVSVEYTDEYTWQPAEIVAAADGTTRTFIVRRNE